MLEKFALLPYNFGDETRDKIDEKFENIGNPWNNEEEYKIAVELNNKLPGEKNQYDRGILLDAIQNDCQYLINENWTDFNKMSEIAKSHDVEVTTLKRFLEGY